MFISQNDDLSREFDILTCMLFTCEWEKNRIKIVCYNKYPCSSVYVEVEKKKRNEHQ